MKKYFYSDGKEKHGPLSLEELKQESITKDTLIWFKGLEDWKVAYEIEELNEIFQLISLPVIEDECEIINNEFYERMSKLSDNELKLIVINERKDYNIEALRTAEFELKNRNLFDDDLAMMIKEEDAKIKIQSQKQNSNKGNLFISFLFAFLTFIVVNVAMSSFSGGLSKILPIVSAYLIFKFIRD